MFTWCGVWKENGRKNSVQREPRNWMFVSCQRVTEQNDNIKRGNEVNYVQQLSRYVTVTVQQTFGRCPISSVSKIQNNELYFSKAGSDSFFRWKGEEAPLELGSVHIDIGNHWVLLSLFILTLFPEKANSYCFRDIGFIFWVLLIYFGQNLKLNCKKLRVFHNFGKVRILPKLLTNHTSTFIVKFTEPYCISDLLFRLPISCLKSR